MGEKKYSDRDFEDLHPNQTEDESTTHNPRLAEHVPQMIKIIEEQEKIEREVARAAATSTLR